MVTVASNWKVQEWYESNYERSGADAVRERYRRVVQQRCGTGAVIEWCWLQMNERCMSGTKMLMIAAVLLRLRLSTDALCRISED